MHRANLSSDYSEVIQTWSGILCDFSYVGSNFCNSRKIPEVLHPPLSLCLLFRAARGPPSCENEQRKYSLKRYKMVSRGVLQVLLWKSYWTCKVGSCHCLVLAGLPGVGGIVLPLYLCCLRSVHFLLPKQCMMVILFCLPLRIFLQKLLKKTSIISKYSRGVKPPRAHNRPCFL